MFTFKSINDFIPGRFERVGALKGKRWYKNNNDLSMGLFKPQRYEFGDRKVFCANHYGEFMGYLLAREADILSCRAELASLDKYFPNIHKERNGGTPISRNGCIIYSELERGQLLEPGIVTIEKTFGQNKDYFENQLGINCKFPAQGYFNDNIEVVLKSIETRIRSFYESKGNMSQSEIDFRVAKNIDRAIQMIVYDCLYGNNDRHDENWSMVMDMNEINLYPLYDNERVLGLFENQRVIEEIVHNGTVVQSSEEINFSRMKVPGEPKRYSSYKDVLKYLIENYPSQTVKALTTQLTVNTPQRVEDLLSKCEGLPTCYIDYARLMYRDRHSFAINLLERYIEPNDQREVC